MKMTYLGRRLLNLNLGGPNKLKVVEMKITSNGKCPQHIKSGISQNPLIGSSSNLKLKIRGQNQNKKSLAMKTSSNGRQPKNITSGISQKPLIGSSSNLKLKLIGPTQTLILLAKKTTSDGR